MAPLSSAAMFLLNHPLAIVAFAIVAILIYSLVREQYEEKRVKNTPEKPHEDASFGGSLKHAGIVCVVLLAALGLTRGCEQPINRTEKPPSEAAKEPEVQTSTKAQGDAKPQESQVPVQTEQQSKKKGKAKRVSQITPPAPAPSVPTAPSSAAAPAPTQNYAPGGFAVSGGTLWHPEVNNYRNPLPQIDVAPSTPIEAVPIPAPTSVHMGLPPMQRGADKPGASVIVTLKGTFYNPAFVADCDVPCALSTAWTMYDGSERSDSDQFQPLGTPDHMSAGVAYTVSQMLSGHRVRLEFRSLDSRPLTVTNVRPYAPPQ